MDPLGSEGTPGLLDIGTSQGHFCGGSRSLVQIVAKVRHVPPFDRRAIARGLAVEVVLPALAGHTDSRKPS